ncbi:hypothetical protein [Mucilaginibacter glaciei]|uniref:Prevent-host-death family protein n=1 Tax=Mucilaginibacter glaciei TaxID=2772109 RepID=A0A926S148_9SPHI|nr:hypothetical protein [Mucilaginibacter glaciei]MBD1392412.1 hypothetical protein [Mucilaginibacter glaciei]
MLTLHPQFIKDDEGNNSLVVLPISEFESIMEELDDLEDVRLYDEAKKEDDGERISMEEYLNLRKSKDA